MEQIIKDFLELVQIPVASRNERAIADCIIKKLKDLGLEVQEDDTAAKIGGNTGNIYALLKGDSSIEPILFSAHLDRVKNNGEIAPIIDKAEGKIKADGKTILAADDVSGICVTLEALRRVIDSGKPHGDIEVAFSVCEEAGVLGSKHYDFTKFKAKKAYVFDAPGRIGKIVLQAPAKAKITYQIHGLSAHAGNEPEKGINAAKGAAALVMALPDSRITPMTTTNVSTILAGGKTTNVVCDYAEVLAEARSTDAKEFEAILAEFEKPVAEIEKQYGVKIECLIEVLYQTFKIEQAEEIAQIAAKALTRLGVEVNFARGGGGMDGNHFNNNGIQAVGIAPGYFKNHTNDEYVYIEDLIKCGEVAYQLSEIVAGR
ncbi:MAG TPA: M20/M25/M40 family metallo-hydrolase [Candidatus Avacidaminococcus intestinavium]|uniref:M20/M25/M40 family metallo-hydrolase n=1 Tax=Candidatus Avacidaminococcus intestinavium TaxID=2840684 RepID=A0A9D1MNP2_9FIRM|nr:M20/M25/M40 family metallo-hydrolase [Candidatus Avacidaminococcus intestinavium]